MLWFNKKSQTTVEDQEKLVQSTSIEIVAHKDAKAEVIKEAHQVNARLNNLLVGNGFTLKIYLAAGGRQPKTNKGTH